MNVNKCPVNSKRKSPLLTFRLVLRRISHSKLLTCKLGEVDSTETRPDLEEWQIWLGVFLSLLSTGSVLTNMLSHYCLGRLKSRKYREMPVSSCVYFRLHLFYQWNSLKSKLSGFREVHVLFFLLKLPGERPSKFTSLFRLRFRRYLRLNRKIYFRVGFVVGRQLLGCSVLFAANWFVFCHLGFLICRFSLNSLFHCQIVCY